MSATATRAPDAPETPEAPEKKRKLTVAQAAARYCELKPALEELVAMFEEAQSVLRDYFESTGRGCYKDLIGWKWSGGAEVLDQAQAKELLAGAGIEVPKKTTQRSRSLTLLK